MSLQGRDLQPWYIDMAERIDKLYGLPVRFRQHPVEVERGLIRHVPNTVYSKDTLENDLANAAVVVTFNSNTATDAVLAGKHTITFDEGAMAWPVTDHLLEIGDTYDREQWAYRMAWKQWRVDELASGEGVEKIIEVMP